MTILRASAFLATIFVLHLGGCAMFGDKPDNSPAKLREALEVPPDLARPASDDLAAVPSSGVAAYSDYTSKSPAVSSGSTGQADAKANPSAATPAVADEMKSVRLERDGALRWLVVQEVPDQVMERVRRYLASRNMKLEIDDPKSGIFETQWMERKINLGTNVLSRMLASMQSTGLRDKFRFRIEPGRVAGTSEVYVSHQGLEEVMVDNNTRSMWQPRATDVQAEAEQLSSLMSSFGMSAQEATDQIGKVATGSTVKVKDSLLLQKQDMDQAWRRVGQALDRSRYAIEDRDRDRGIYYVHDRTAAGAAKKKSFFGGWLKIGESEEAPEDRFQVVLKATAGDVSVKVLNVKGERTDSKNGLRLLNYLQQQLQ